MAKGYGNGETTTHANSHINVAGTTYQNVGGDYVVDGAVEKGNRMTGHIGGAIKATSRQVTATYEGKQTNAGFSADIDLVVRTSSVIYTLFKIKLQPLIRSKGLSFASNIIFFS